jgi:hypothetical protein
MTIELFPYLRVFVRAAVVHDQTPRSFSNADYATDLAAMIADFVAYGNARDGKERLGAKLEIPGSE